MLVKLKKHRKCFEYCEYTRHILKCMFHFLPHVSYRCLPSFTPSISQSLAFCFLSSVIYFVTVLGPFLYPRPHPPLPTLSLSG